MNLSEEQLNVVEEMAGLFFPPELIAINLQLREEDAESFFYGVEMEETSLAIVAFYYKGRLEADLTLRRAIKQSALNGSSPSQQMMLEFKRDSKR